MLKASQVAHYLIHLAESEAEPELMSNLRLQKLLYYVQGWALAMRGDPMFAEPVEAWRDGPVVREVWAEFHPFGAGKLCSDEAKRAGLEARDMAFVDSIWESYREFSAYALRRKTHDERPWQEAREGCEPNDRSSNAISQVTMAEFFKQTYAKENKLKSLGFEDLADLYRADRPARGTPIVDVLLRAGLREEAAAFRDAASY